MTSDTTPSKTAIQKNRNNHLPALDGIRALAAAMVVLYHAKLPGLPGGYMAVDVFFVLSGFLITRILLRGLGQGSFSYHQFCTRRLYRLWPALLVFLTIYLLTAPLIFDWFPFYKHFRDVLFTATYIVNYTSVVSEGTALLGHVWTLAVEMQFYVLWPMVVVLLIRLPKRLALVVLVTLFLLATANRWWQATPDMPWGFYVRTDARASGLILGALLAFMQFRVNHYWAMAGLLLLAFAMTFYSTQWIPSARYGFTIAELGAALLIMSQPAWLGMRFWHWLATLSYGWYLWHYYFMKILQYYGVSWGYTLLIGGLGGLLAAWLSYKLVEQRFYQPGYKAKLGGRG